jgi:hypothetical protein
MATYRLEAKIIKRSEGRSATASAAYRAAVRIDDERTGQGFDYTRKRGVLHSEILAPAGTPAWMQDRAQLWNAVEKVEKRKDAQLARDLVLSLPHELTHEQRVELVREFVRGEFVAQGMIADLSIHAPDRRGDGRNHHAHVMLTMRELAGDGFGNKNRAWNETEQLEQWREEWARAVNRHLERHGHEARVDHRSLEAQGVDREPEPKQGPLATEMEREGRPSNAGDDRRAAQARNEERAKIAAELEAVTAQIIDLAEERARRAEKERAMEQQRAAEAAEAQRKEQARQAEEAATQQAREAEQQRRQAAAQEIAAQTPEALARRQAEQQTRQLEAMREQRARLDLYEAEQQRRAEEARQEEERKRAAVARGQQAEGEIRDAGDRYRVALGQHYDIRDPYGSLARSAMAEYGSFIRDREQFKQRIAREQDPEARKALELRRDIEAADYMAVTSRRIASQSEVIVGRRDSEEAVKFRERAGGYEAQSKELRQQYRDLAAERAEKAAPAPTPQQKAAEAAPAPAKADPTQGQEKPLMVAASAPGRGPEKLSVVVDRELARRADEPPPRTITPAEYIGSADARRAYHAQQGAEAGRADALNRIGVTLKAGKDLALDDLRGLSRHDLKEMKAKGDNHLRGLVAELGREAGQGRDYGGRERER